MQLHDLKLRAGLLLQKPFVELDREDTELGKDLRDRNNPTQSSDRNLKNARFER